MLNSFLHFIKTNQLFEPHERLLVTVSGGVDSVVLVHLCHEAKLKFGIAHCNFQLRGVASDEDEAFVQQLSLQYRVDCYVQRFETTQFAQHQGFSTQMAARELRYDWFEELRQRHHYDVILTAHHQDDLLETVLLNLTRGTGLAGLHGILPKNGHLVRPLLFATRQNIELYLQENQLAWREDSSNATTDYVRNRLRHQVVPILRDINPKVAARVSDLAERIVAIEQIVAESIDQSALQIIQKKGNALWIDFRALAFLSSPLERLSYWLKDYGFTYHQTKEIWSNPTLQVGKVFFSATHVLSIDRTHWVVSPIEKEENSQYLIETYTGGITYIAGYLKWHLSPPPAPPFAPHSLCLDADLLHFPLVLRRWQSGDWFCPLGMNGKRKKISDFLIDHKVPRHLKNQVYLLVSEQKIVGVVGFQADERYKITEHTKKTILFQLL
ncbi:MAG: tRNA lysidine(34) synthetase TilS [Spirosomataceae bacterium]